MSLRCDLCDRKPLKSATRSHSNIKTKRRQFLNLQTKKIGDKKIRICTKCLKTQLKRV